VISHHFFYAEHPKHSNGLSSGLDDKFSLILTLGTLIGCSFLTLLTSIAKCLAPVDIALVLT
jgi:hypothetical protein